MPRISSFRLSPGLKGQSDTMHMHLSTKENMPPLPCTGENVNHDGLLHIGPRRTPLFSVFGREKIFLPSLQELRECKT